MKFKTTIFQKGNNLGIEVPETIIQQLGAGKKPPVVVVIKNYTYKSTVGVMGGTFLIPFSSEHRKHIELNGGEIFEVSIDVDKDSRRIELPTVLKDKLKNDKSAQEFFESLSPSYQKKIVISIESAKTEETLNKRLEKIASDLTNKLKP